MRKRISVALSFGPIVALMSPLLSRAHEEHAHSPFVPTQAVTTATIEIPITIVSAVGVEKNIGSVIAANTKYGLLLTPKLSGLKPGVHGFHVHQNGSCNPGDKDGKKVAALAAGGHYDPANTGKHEGPYGDGHAGDLPPLFVTVDGNATTPVLAPRLKVADIRGRSLMVHEHGDTFSDKPEALGGGGPRLACGVVK